MANITYNRNIEGLRAIAVFSVILYHYLPEYFPNGWLGVDLFFVISGYVITNSILSFKSRNFVNFYLEFLLRRMVRLLPALFFMVIVVLILSSNFYYVHTEALSFFWSVIFFYSNILFYAKTLDYFAAEGLPNFFDHTWSLSVEWQFYFIAPVSYWFFRNFSNKKLKFYFYIFAMVLSLCSYLLNGGHDQPAVFFLPFFRFWEFIVGVLLASYLQDNPVKNFRFNVNLYSNVCLSFLLLIMLSSFGVSRELSSLGTVFFTVIIIYYSTLNLGIGGHLANKYLCYFGTLSYGLYLWHWPLFILAQFFMPLNAMTYFLCFSFSILFSVFSKFAIERPATIYFRNQISRNKFLISFLIFSFLYLFIIVSFLLLDFKANRNQSFQDLSNGRQSLFEPFVSETGVVWHGVECSIINDEDIGKDINIERCLVGKNIQPNSRKVLVLGNSFAPAFISAFDFVDLPTKDRPAIIVAPKFGASPVPDMSWPSHSTDATHYYWNSVVPKLISQLDAGDSILLVSDLSKLSNLDDNSINVLLTQFEVGLEKLSASLSAQGISLSIVGPIPLLREAKCDPETGFNQWLSREEYPCVYFTKDQTYSRFQRVFDIFDRLSANDYITVIDLFDVFCTTVCGYTDGYGNLLYRDVYSHPSRFASERARPLFEKWFVDLVR